MTQHRTSLYVGATALLVGMAVLGLLIGSTSQAFGQVLSALFGQGESTLVFVVRQVRLPAVLLAAAVGAAHALSGAAMQGILRNPLADPYLLGVAGGAALAAAAVIGIWPDARAMLPAVAFGGALAATAVVVSVARALPGGARHRDATTTLLLSGVVLNAFAGALILVVHAWARPQQSQEVLLWLMGAIVPARVHAPGAVLALAVGCIAALALIRVAPALNLLALGESEARTLGVEPARVRRTVLLANAALVGAAVAFTGLIGFIGLLVPHIVRMVAGADHRHLLPLSALTGAAFLIAADAIARVSAGALG
ncbi:MAG: iron complex transport system permease protein, partial [Bradymonadia bacterium]